MPDSLLSGLPDAALELPVVCPAQQDLTLKPGRQRVDKLLTNNWPLLCRNFLPAALTALPYPLAIFL